MTRAIDASNLSLSLSQTHDQILKYFLLQVDILQANDTLVTILVFLSLFYFEISSREVNHAKKRRLDALSKANKNT